jgi:probable rRNA maturation factor
MIEINNRTKYKVNKSEIIKIVEKFLKYNKIKNKDVSIAFVGDAEMRRINKIYRRIDKATDVLSFSGEGDFLGEIIISPAQIKKQAAEFSKGSFRKELAFILVHGLLHLLGHNDRTEKEKKLMLKLGEKFINLKLKKLGT